MPRCPECQTEGDVLGTPCPQHPELRLADSVHLEKYEDDVLLGRVVSQRWAVVRVLGEGGMGRIYEAHGEPGEERAALKVLKANHADSATVRERFMREARIMGMLNHPNVVSLLDYGSLVEGGNELFMAMELVRGRTLDAVLANPRRFRANRMMMALRGIAAGLASAHAQGVVHRDLKPGNIILVKDQHMQESPRIVDFGIARIDDAPQTITKTGMVFGTPAFMSPEQAAGRTGIGPEADIYAFGIMLFQMLTGDLPYAGSVPMQVVKSHLIADVPVLQLREGLEVPESMIALCYRCLAKRPDGRPKDGGELERELSKAAADLQAKREMRSHEDGPLDLPLRPRAIELSGMVVAPAVTEPMTESELEDILSSDLPALEEDNSVHDTIHSPMMVPQRTVRSGPAETVLSISPAPPRRKSALLKWIAIAIVSGGLIAGLIIGLLLMLGV